VCGDFADEAALPPAITGVALELCALDLVAQWGRCGMSADWLAAYFAYDFEPTGRAAANAVLATAVNEVLENAAKFCADKRGVVRLAIRHHGDVIRIETTTVADRKRAQAFRDVLEELDRADLGELFASRVEHQREPGASGVGLIVLKRDYRARIGARLKPRPDGHWEVRVQVVLNAEDIR
jgi:hypothetical protein